MPYAGHRLTNHERAERVRARRLAGFPLHAPPHPFREVGAFLITAATYLHQPHLSTPERRSSFKATLCARLSETDIDLHAWVILPNHYHVLVDVPQFEQLAAVIKSLHGTTSRQWNLEDDCVGRRLWYRYYDRKIRNEAHFMQALNYIHANPVKHGYCTQALEWPWSSLPGYLQVEGAEWLADQERVFRPDKAFGDGWDGDEQP